MAMFARVAAHAIPFLFLFSRIAATSTPPDLTGMWYTDQQTMMYIANQGSQLVIEYYDDNYYNGSSVGLPIPILYDYPLVNWSFIFGEYAGEVNADGTVMTMFNGFDIRRFRTETCDTYAPLQDPSWGNTFLQSCVMCNWIGCTIGCFCVADQYTLEYNWENADKTMLPTYSLIDVNACPLGVLNFEGTLNCEVESITVAPTTPAPTRATTLAPTTPPPTIGGCAKDTAFPTNLNDIHCTGLKKSTSTSELGCRQSCCSDSTCEIYQWCPLDSTTCSPGCYTGRMGTCFDEPGWISGAKDVCGAVASGNYTLNCLSCSMVGCTLTCKACQNNQTSSLDLNTCQNGPLKDDAENVVTYFGYLFAPVVTNPLGTALKCLHPRVPTRAPTTFKPTLRPTVAPTTKAPAVGPTTKAPSAKPTTHAPTPKPTTNAPTTKPPVTGVPTKPPTNAPSSKAPTAKPTTKTPTAKPTTKAPIPKPTLAPKPTRGPSTAPTTKSPTAKPTTKAPTAKPTTKAPTAKPTTKQPTAKPTTKAPV